MSARRIPPNPALFDLVIIDEASQCSLPAVVPLLFRAERALIIGDVMQLPHISTLPAQRDAELRRTHNLTSEWLDEHRMSVRRHSSFHAAERAAGGSLLLDEHYRCHPEIAAVSNEFFYGGRLTVLTDIRGRPTVEFPAVSWESVRGRAARGPAGRSWCNAEEVTRARSHLAVVGDDVLWERRGGVGAALRRAAHTAAPPAANGIATDLTDRLLSTLRTLPDSTVKLGVGVQGHRADALVTTGDGPVPVVLDPGVPLGQDPVGHLRRTLRRRELLSAPAGRPAVRLPAWTLYDPETSIADRVRSPNLTTPGCRRPTPEPGVGRRT